MENVLNYGEGGGGVEVSNSKVQHICAIANTVPLKEIFSLHFISWEEKVTGKTIDIPAKSSRFFFLPERLPNLYNTLSVEESSGFSSQA